MNSPSVLCESGAEIETRIVGRLSDTHRVIYERWETFVRSDSDALSEDSSLTE